MRVQYGGDERIASILRLSIGRFSDDAMESVYWPPALRVHSGCNTSAIDSTSRPNAVRTDSRLGIMRFSGEAGFFTQVGFDVKKRPSSERAVRNRAT